MSSTIPIRPANAATHAFEYFSTKKDELWVVRKFSLFVPVRTACCSMEFMAVSSSPTTPTARGGAARFSPRQSTC